MGARGRVPVSREEVQQAIEALQAAGTTVTIRAVRDHIGRGSFSTIKAHMDALFAYAATPAEHLNAFSPRLGVLCEEMISHMRVLADETLATERAHFEKQRDDQNSKWEAVNHARELAQSQLNIERQHSQEQKTRIKDLEKLFNTSQSELHKSSQELAKANAHVESLTVRATKAESTLATERTQHHHYKQEIETQQRTKKEEHEQAVGQLNGKVRALTEEGIELKVEVSKWKGHADTLEERLKRSNDALESAKLERGMLQDAHDKLQELVGSLSIQQTRDAATLAKATNQLNDALSEVTAKSNAITKLQGDMINMQKQADAARQSTAEEHKGLIRNLIAHARAAFELAKATAPKGSSELEELERSQRNIEQLLA